MDPEKDLVRSTVSFDAIVKYALRKVAIHKAINCTPHKIVIAKLEAYGFSFNALQLIHSYVIISNEGSNMATNGDDNTPYALDKDISAVVTKLENGSCILFQWLSDNALKEDTRKYHLLSSVSDNKIAASINNNVMYNEDDAVY